MTFLLLLIQIRGNLQGCTHSNTKELSLTGQDKVILVEGANVCLNVTDTDTIVVFNSKDRVNIEAVYSPYESLNETYPLSNKEIADNPNVSAVYFGDKYGLIKLSAKFPTTATFVWGNFPPDCENRYVTNLRNYSYIIKNNTGLISVCFFNAVNGGYSFTATYNVPEETDSFRIVRHDGRPRVYLGDNKISGISTKDEPIVIKIETTRSDSIVSYVNFTCKTSTEDIADLNVTEYFSIDQPPMYVIGTDMDDEIPDTSLSLSSLIVTIIILIVIISCAIGAIIYKVLRYFKLKKLREEHLYKQPKYRYKKIIKAHHKKKKNHRNRHHKQSTQDPIISLEKQFNGTL